MKKYLIISCIFLSLVTSLTGCKDELEEKYLNPEKSTTASLAGFFTGILDNGRVRSNYWNVRTFLLQQPAVYTQTASFSNGENPYQPDDSYLGQYWSDFYATSNNGSGALGMYRAMQVEFNKSEESEKAGQELIMNAARVALYEQASKMVDLWGDIPFSEAGALQATSKISNPKFDSQTELYNMFIDSLNVASKFFASASSTSTFAKADILLSGSVDKWRRYANSLRLRLLMRISNVDEAGAQAKVMEMLNNPEQYPLIDGNNVGSYSPGSLDILLFKLTNYNNDLRDALTEINSFYAPDYLLNSIMLPSNDPRIPIMFDKFGKTVDNKFVPNTEYKAMPISFNATEQAANFRNFSTLDSITFLQNPTLPGILITAAEINFLKAEAYQRWGSTEQAKSAYETALRQSISFYYYLYNLNAKEEKKIDMSALGGQINEFITNSPASFSGTLEDKLSLIWIQKWVHLGFLQSIEAWSEYRRTDYPKLTFPVSSSSTYPTPPVRLVYPTVEKTLNSANYQKVQSKDTRDTRVFWDVK